MSEELLPYSAEDARRLRRGIGWGLLLAAPGWTASAYIISALGLGAWPLAILANAALTALGLALLALAD